MGNFARENGFVRGAVLLLLLIIVAGAVYLVGSRGVDVGETGKSVALDLEKAAKTVRDTSEDAILTTKVKAAIALSKSASTFDIDVDSDEGVVTLEGALPSSEDKAAVLSIARSTDGVLSVVDRIQVDRDAARLLGDEEAARRLADLQIETAVYERLLASEGIDARRVRVTVEGGVVRLSGSVPDSSQKELVQQLVTSVAGVGSVRNDLEIQAPAAARESLP
jgi:hyperosmotically inducible periplasmic protein